MRLPEGRAFYVFVLALPVAMFAYLRSIGEWGLDASPGFTVAWMVSLAPLALVSLRVGIDNVAARRRDYAMLAGLVEVVRRAVGRRSVERPEPPKPGVSDEPVAAVIWGIAVGLVFPVFFMSVMPDLRRPAGAVWLIVAGALAGGATYCRYRAMAYLENEPPMFGPLRQWRLMSPDRYAPPGRPFVRAQIVLTILLPLWWLGVGGFFVL